MALHPISGKHRGKKSELNVEEKSREMKQSKTPMATDKTLNPFFIEADLADNGDPSRSVPV